MIHLRQNASDKGKLAAKKDRSTAGRAGWATARLPHYVLIFARLSAQYGTCRITFRKWRWHLLLEYPSKSIYDL
jgi:hypothetical protein